MAEAPTPDPIERAPSPRRRGAMLLLALVGSVALLTTVAWVALSSGPRDPAPVARVARAGDPSLVAGPSTTTDADAPSSPLGAGDAPSVLPTRSVAVPVREEENECWSKRQSGATEPWLVFRVVDATTGAPLASAIVRTAASAEALAAQDDDCTSARADANGMARLWDPPRGLGPNLPWLLATADRHAPALLPVTAAMPAGTHEFCVRGRTIALPLVAARPLTVRVTRRDERGDAVPVAHARVVARAPWAEEADWFSRAKPDAQLRQLLTFEGRTDAKGDAAFVPLARQPWRIHVAATGFDSEDLVISAAQTLAGVVEVALRPLYVAAVALPANGLAASPSLEWDGAPAWYAPDAIEWIPDHLTGEERAAATALLARRRDVAEALEPGTELRCRFATLHSAALAEGRPAAVAARAQVLPGEERVDVALTFVPFESLSRDDVFVARAPPIAAPGRVHLRWWGEPTPPARLVGTLVRNDADDDPIFVRDLAISPHELDLELPPGHYLLDGSIGDHALLVMFDVREGEDRGSELSRTSTVSSYGYLDASAGRALLAVHDSLGRARLHFELTTERSDAPYPRFRTPRWGASMILTRHSRHDPASPFVVGSRLAQAVEKLRLDNTNDVTIEAFGCVPTFFPRVHFGFDAPSELELDLDESAATEW